MTDSKPLAPGTRLGPYTLGTPLGSGASATVYRATDTAGRSHAVKVRRLGVVSLDRRFLREFEAMRSLRLPGVVRVYEAGIEEDLLWFSMDLIDGKGFLDEIHTASDIETRVKRTAELGKQLLDILAGLHQAGFVHRDVKPSNVLVDGEGRVRVLDFGIARFFGEGDSTTGSDSGQVLGTVPFMSPEQLAGLPFDHRIDLFATGLVLYEAVDGLRPRPSTPVGWIPRICLERLMPLACKHREVSRKLSHVIERLLSVDPDDRPTAGEAAQELRRLLAGDTGGDWPEPPWVDVGDLIELEGCLGSGQHPAVQVLDGPIGSGRRRTAEQLHRQAVVQGIWPIHVHCRIDGMGAPIARLLETLLGASDDPAWRREIAADDADALRRMWPHLPIPGTGGAGPLPAMTEIAQAAARSVVRASGRRAILVIMHAADAIDELSSLAAQRIGAAAGGRLGLLILHESRWASPRSRQLVSALKARGAGIRALEGLTSAQSTAIAAALCPGAPPTDVPAGTPQRAIEAGLQALSAWRGEVFPAAEAFLWPLVLMPHVPDAVFVRLAGKAALDHPLVKREDGAVAFSGLHAWRMIASRLADPRSSAASLAEAWLAELGERADPGDVATLWLLAAEPSAAFAPALAAARVAEEYGRYADARRWLIVLDLLPHDPAAERSFDLPYVRARVVLRTESGAPRTTFIEVVERVAKGDEEQLAKVLRAEYQIRSGEIRPALVTALRVASPNQNPTPEAAVRALLVATTARFMLGQFEEARPQLDRARAILAETPVPQLEVQASNLLAELLYRTGDLAGCRRLLQDTIRRASETRYVRGAAFASSRLAQVLRALGKRMEAEHQMRTAREAFHETSDQDLEAETELELATLRAERGDAAAARHLVDDALRRIQGTAGEDVLARAMRVALIVATLRADTTDATLALSTVENSRDPEAPAVLVRWWRSRGDVDRAMRVDPPPMETFGCALWRIERARAALVSGDLATAGSEADTGLAIATRRGFAEVALYGRLLLGVVRPIDDAAWKDILRACSVSLYTEVFLGAIEMDARRLHAAGDAIAARAQWRSLKARGEELGYAPGVEEASGWLANLGD